MICIQNLSKKFGTKTVLQDINISFDAGKVYGIVGENGAGKTTLFRCIAGLEAYEGTISTDSEKPLKEHLGFLLTEPYFFQKITGLEYLRLLCQARAVDVGNIEARNIFELPLKEYASSYSTGMKKKLALTAILLQGNDLFILDEPYNGVDIQSNMLITEIIHQLKKLHKTILISSHIFSTLNESCDEIHVLKEGRFVKSVSKADFSVLEAEMKQLSLGTKVERLELR